MHVSKLSACFVALTAATIWHNSIVKFLAVRMVGSLLIRGRSYPSKVALMAKAICALALVLDIVGRPNIVAKC